MIIVSLCAGFGGFWGRLFFANSPYVQIGDSGDNRTQGDVGLSALRSFTNYRKVLLLVCGYNNSEENAIASYKTLEAELRQRGIIDSTWVVVGLLWPGHTVAGFWGAEASANSAGKRLRELLLKLTPLELHVETHSLGARVFLQAMNSTDPKPPTVDTTCLTSPAVDDECLDAGQEFNAAAIACGKLLVCYSGHDPVLKEAFRWFGSIGPKHPLGDAALGFSGPQDKTAVPPNVQLEDGTAYVAEHGAWRSAPNFYDRWKALLAG